MSFGCVIIMVIRATKNLTSSRRSIINLLSAFKIYEWEITVTIFFNVLFSHISSTQDGYSYKDFGKIPELFGGLLVSKCKPTYINRFQLAWGILSI